MNWNQNKSVILSRVCVIFFAVLLAALDLSAYWTTRYFVDLSGQLSGPQYLHLMILFYLCSAAGWAALWNLWRLLKNIRNSQVFVTENVALMRAVSWCCFAVGIICAAGTVIVYPLLLLVALAAGFMGLIVRIVKNAFEQAISMKDELDFTV